MNFYPHTDTHRASTQPFHSRRGIKVDDACRGLRMKNASSWIWKQPFHQSRKGWRGVYSVLPRPQVTCICCFLQLWANNLFLFFKASCAGKSTKAFVKKKKSVKCCFLTMNIKKKKQSTDTKVDALLSLCMISYLWFIKMSSWQLGVVWTIIYLVQ